MFVIIIKSIPLLDNQRIWLELYGSENNAKYIDTLSLGFTVTQIEIKYNENIMVEWHSGRV